MFRLLRNSYRNYHGNSRVSKSFFFSNNSIVTTMMNDNLNLNSLYKKRATN